MLYLIVGDRMRKKVVIGCLAFLLLCGCGKKEDLVKYESDLLGVDFSSYVVSSSGSLGDDYADVTFTLNEDSIESVERILDANFSIVDEESFGNLYGTKIYEDITNFCPESNIVQVYDTFVSGEEVKSREIYLTFCSKDEKFYLNLRG